MSDVLFFYWKADNVDALQRGFLAHVFMAESMGDRNLVIWRKLFDQRTLAVAAFYM
jgi:hypothetical protein